MKCVSHGTSGNIKHKNSVEDATEKKMPSTHISSYSHLIFSTKNRLPLIKVDWQDRLHAYLGGTVKGMDAVALAVGGISDHVHLLVSLKSKHRLDYFFAGIKGGIFGLGA